MINKKVTPSTELSVLEDLCNKNLSIMTNQAYVAGYKFSYGLDFRKGTGALELDGKKTKDYYGLTLYVVDKTDNPVGLRTDLATNYYPTKRREEDSVLLEAYKEFILNSMRTFVNVHYALYVENREKEVVKPEDVKLDEVVDGLRESAKTPKLITGLKEDGTPKLFIK